MTGHWLSDVGYYVGLSQPTGNNWTRGSRFLVVVLSRIIVNIAFHILNKDAILKIKLFLKKFYVRYADNLCLNRETMFCVPVLIR